MVSSKQLPVFNSKFLISKENFIKFYFFNFIFQILGQMHLAYFHIYDPCVTKRGKKDLFSRVKYLLEFLSEPEYLLWLKKLVSTKILVELQLKATYLRDLF